MMYVLLKLQSNFVVLPDCFAWIVIVVWIYCTQQQP